MAANMNNDTNDNANNDATTTSSSSSSSVAKGVAGRTHYAQWDKVATDLVQEHDALEEQERREQAAQLGLDGKYARSQAEAHERQKHEAAQTVKKTLDQYQTREEAVVQTLTGLMGAVDNHNNNDDNNNNDIQPSSQPSIRRVTRQDMDAGTRVLRLQDTCGQGVDQSTLVLTQDLSLLESQMSASVNPQAKSYDGDAENAAPSPTDQRRSIFGLIKVFLQNVHHCTVLVKCKLIAGVLELHHCSHVTIKVLGPEATVATVQADLSSDVRLEFRDAPSGQNQPAPGRPVATYWGDDTNDRIFHAGVSNLTVQLYRDDLLEHECTADYQRDGAQAVGNATAEEMQYVTSVVDGTLVTEAVVRTGSTTGKQVRAMTEREMEAERKQRQAAERLAVEKAESMIQIKDKDGNPVVTKGKSNANNNDNVQEVLLPSVQAIVDECQENKAKGNEAFGAGEYGQAILLYSLALDKAHELPNDDDDDDKKALSLFPCDVVYSNRAACFLKLGQHEKAEQDAARALLLNPDNLKALFRQGLALHAMGRYAEARPLLAKASKQEPKNKQIQQALQFCEVRLEQEHRKRMAG